MGTDCASLLVDLYLYTYEYEFRDSLTKSKKLYLAKKKKITFRYLDAPTNIINKNFNTNISDIYPPELELKKTTEFTTTVSYIISLQYFVIYAIVTSHTQTKM